jgi:hypothetical protein
MVVEITFRCHLFVAHSAYPRFTGMAEADSGVMRERHVADTAVDISPLLAGSGDVGVSNDVTSFGIVTEEITPQGARRQTYSFRSSNDNYSL